MKFMSGHSPWAQSLNRLKEHLLYGTSHGSRCGRGWGVVVFVGDDFGPCGAVPESGVLADIAQVIASLTLFTAVLGGYIAYSMADKPGLTRNDWFLGGGESIQYRLPPARLWSVSCPVLWLIYSRRSNCQTV